MNFSDIFSRLNNDNSQWHKNNAYIIHHAGGTAWKYYNIHETDKEKYLVQTQSQIRICGTKLPVVYGIDKCVDAILKPKRQARRKPLMKK